MEEQITILENKIILLEDEIEFTNLGLDALGAPRNSPKGTPYSLMDRIGYLEKLHIRQLSEIRNAFINGINPFENEL